MHHIWRMIFVLAAPGVTLAVERTLVSSGPVGATASINIEMIKEPAVWLEAWDVIGEVETRVRSIAEGHIGFPDLVHGQMNREYGIPDSSENRRYFRKQTVTSAWANSVRSPGRPSDNFIKTTAGQMNATIQRGLDNQDTIGGGWSQTVDYDYRERLSQDMYGGTTYYDQVYHMKEQWSGMSQAEWVNRPGYRTLGYPSTTRTLDDGKPSTPDVVENWSMYAGPYWQLPWQQIPVDGPTFWGAEFMSPGYQGGPKTFGSPITLTASQARFEIRDYLLQPDMLTNSFTYSLVLSEEDTLAQVTDRIAADRAAAAFDLLPWGTYREVSSGGTQIYDRSSSRDSLWLYNWQSSFATDGYFYQEEGQARFNVPEALHLPNVGYRARMIEFFTPDSTYETRMVAFHEVELKEGAWVSRILEPAVPTEDGVTQLEFFSMAAETTDPHPILTLNTNDTDTAPPEFSSRRPTFEQRDFAGTGYGTRQVINNSGTLQQINLSDTWGSLWEWPEDQLTVTWALLPGATTGVRLWLWQDDGTPLGAWTRLGANAQLQQYFGSPSDYIFAELTGPGLAGIRVTIEIAGQKVFDDLAFSSTHTELAVDANRDGQIKLSSEDTTDATTAASSYRFWINDDIDRGHTVDGTDYEQDDIGGAEAAGMEPDWKDNVANSRRDLEDFARLVVSTSGLSDAFRNGDLYIGLKWTDTVGAPSIKLYKQYDPTGGTSYLTDDYQASVQLAENAILNQRYPSDDVASPSAHTVVTPGDVFVLPQALWFGLSGVTLKRSLLFEGCTAGTGQLKLVILKRENGNYTEIGDGPGVWLDLRNIRDMYEHWTVGQGPVPYGGGAPGALSQASSFTYTAQSPEESKYILFVHGWNMEKWEKERYAETAYKRLYWQGYKGRFGLFSWPTTNGFDESSAIADSTNYDRGEFSAWRSASLLKQKLAQLNGQYPNQVHLLAHSMGNVVAGEALRLAGQDGLGVIVRTYVASQAALPVHCYNGSLPDNLDFDLSAIPAGGAVRLLDGGWPQTANAYKSWLTANSAAVAKRVNFYNVNDWALWHDKWGLNQWFKPDHPDFRPNPPDPQRTYTYLDEVNQPPTQDGFGWLRPGGQVDSSDRPSPYVSGRWYAILRLGNVADVKNRYEIMAMASEARSNALGATSSDEGLGNRVSLTSVWPPDPNPSNDNRSYARHKWHSAQFRSTNMLQKGYWRALLDDRGFNLN